MKTAKEFFKEEYSEHNSMAHYPPSENRITEIMEAYAKYYHEQQVNSVDLADVGESLHICKYCGAETAQSDDTCYRKPE